MHRATTSLWWTSQVVVVNSEMATPGMKQRRVDWDALVVVKGWWWVERGYCASATLKPSSLRKEQ